MILFQTAIQLKITLNPMIIYNRFIFLSTLSPSSDPILTAFQLSDELKRLARAESQFREEYIKLRSQVQQFVSGLVDQARDVGTLCHD